LPWHLRWNVTHQHWHRDTRKQQPEQCAGRREHGLFDDELTHQSATRGAKGGAHGHLTGAFNRAAKDERAEVHRCKQQNQPDGTKKD
jgi:hypothetical protein